MSSERKRSDLYVYSVKAAGSRTAMVMTTTTTHDEDDDDDDDSAGDSPRRILGGEAATYTLGRLIGEACVT